MAKFVGYPPPDRWRAPTPPQGESVFRNIFIALELRDNNPPPPGWSVFPLHLRRECLDSPSPRRGRVPLCSPSPGGRGLGGGGVKRAGGGKKSGRGLRMAAEKGWLHPHQGRHPPRRRGIHTAARLWQVATGLWISAYAEMTIEMWKELARCNNITMSPYPQIIGYVG
jgi:hypothetical protein